MLVKPISATSADGRGTVDAPPFRALLETPTAGAPNAGADLPVIPGYEILAELGRGGMGVVYLARQCSLKRLVALKMILAGVHSNATACQRFRTEAEAAARLTHPNIVQIHEVGEHEGRPFLSLEYVAGGNLEKHARIAPLTEQDAARLVETLARAVHFTHLNGILHRDLKPSNILMSVDGTPKITDFGLAKLMDADAGATQTESVIGTPTYMSPEQAAGNAKKVGAPADVYSLGAILYELLTGRTPFQGSSVLHTLEQVRTQEPTPPRRLRAKLSRDLETICLKCLEKEPANRYAGADALADELVRYLAGEPIQARPIPRWQRAWRVARRRPGRMACAAGVLALVCMMLTFWWHSSVAGELAQNRAKVKFERFVQCRNEALLFGLLTPDEGALFVGGEATANQQAAESAALEALALAGVDPASQTPAVAPTFLAVQQPAVADDCYTLLLVLASIKGRQRLSDPHKKEPYQQALRYIDAAGKLGIQTRAYHLRRAEFLEKAGQPEIAREARNRAESTAPPSALDQFLAGEEQYRRGCFQEASASFDRVLIQQPGHFWAQFFHAVCQLKSQQWNTAKTGLNACLAQQPDFVWGYLFRSFAHEQLQEWANAEADFTKAQQLNPKEDARYVLFLTRGIFYFNQRDYSRAGADFRAAIALKPDQYNGYLNLAHVYVAQDHPDKAADQVQAAMKLRPPVQVVFSYHLECGRRLLRANRYQDALAACETARELCLDRPQPFEVAGHALLRLGRFAEAERSFDDYLKKGGEGLPEVFRGRGEARMKQGKYPEAAEDYTRVVEKTPDADIYYHRGWAHFFADAWKLSLRDFARAVDLNPGLDDAVTGRGLSHVMLGHHREAVADAEEALRRKPSTPEMMHNIACIYAQAGIRVDADLLEKDREMRGAEYRRRAIEAVRATLQMVRPDQRAAFWRDKIVTDSALAPLRNGADFRRLENSVAP